MKIHYYPIEYVNMHTNKVEPMQTLEQLYVTDLEFMALQGVKQFARPRQQIEMPGKYEGCQVTVVSRQADKSHRMSFAKVDFDLKKETDFTWIDEGGEENPTVMLDAETLTKVSNQLHGAKPTVRLENNLWAK